MGNLNKPKEGLSLYEAPFTRRIQVEMEEGICVVASGEDAKVTVDHKFIEVEDYKEVSNEITFD